MATDTKRITVELEVIQSTHHLYLFCPGQRLALWSFGLLSEFIQLLIRMVRGERFGDRGMNDNRYGLIQGKRLQQEIVLGLRVVILIGPKKLIDFLSLRIAKKSTKPDR